MKGLEPSLETGLPGSAGEGYRRVAALVRWALVLVIFLLVSRNPLGNLAIRGILMAEAVGFFLGFFLNPARWNLWSLGELMFLAGLWWFQDLLAGGGTREGIEGGAVVGLFFMVWLPMRGLPIVLRALRPYPEDLEEE